MLQNIPTAPFTLLAAPQPHMLVVLPPRPDLKAFQRVSTSRDLKAVQHIRPRAVHYVPYALKAGPKEHAGLEGLEGRVWVKEPMPWVLSLKCKEFRGLCSTLSPSDAAFLQEQVPRHKAKLAQAEYVRRNAPSSAPVDPDDVMARYYVN